MKYSTFSLELALFENGHKRIAGMDEVGRGCLAGPVVAAIVIISSPDQYLAGVWDSKLMTHKARERIYDQLCESVDGYGFGLSEPSEIDDLGIASASSLAMQRAYGSLKIRPDIVLIDGSKVQAPNLPRMKIQQGDRRHYVMSAASVIAKVYRDRLMRELAKKYTGYGFERHVGYGTKQHMSALKSLGVTDIHRKSFSPVKDVIGRAVGGSE